MGPWPQLTGYGAAAVLLLLFCCVADLGSRDKSPAYDEIAHLTGGYSYWQTGDYRLHPENGMLPQRWAALPLYLEGYAFPERDRRAPDGRKAWQRADVWRIGAAFFYRSGNDLERMLRSGRRMMIAVGAILGLIVYAWSRHLFGPAGGIVSLCLYVLNPNILAHSRLITSDMTAALFLIAATGSLWCMLHKVSALGIVGSGLIVGLLFLSKGSAISILPILFCLICLRFAFGGALLLHFRRERRVEAGRRKIGWIAGALAANALIAFVVIWAFYGFHYASSLQEPMDYPWKKVLSGMGFPGGPVEIARTARILPESYLYGFSYLLGVSQERPAFLNGSFSTTGWWYFFPYSFLVKNPLALLATLGLAGVTIARRWRGVAIPRRREQLGSWLYRTSPLLVLMGVYWGFALASPLNIGHRHVLPTYGPLLILAGSASLCFRERARVGTALVLLLLVGNAVESYAVHPHYLAFFNLLVGGPSNGYRHLVDSSLDWGQDLPGLKRWLDREREGGYRGDVYLSYFGVGSPKYYGIRATRLRGYPDIDPPHPGARLGAGIYCISATMLQNVYVHPRGRWTKALEAKYRAADEFAPSRPSLSRRASWRYARLRESRLFSYLRGREPDDQIGHSILIYRLSDWDIEAALHGPLRELGEG